MLEQLDGVSVPEAVESAEPTAFKDGRVGSWLVTSCTRRGVVTAASGWLEPCVRVMEGSVEQKKQRVCHKKG